MITQIVVGIAILLPFILGLVFRVNALFVFVALCVGYFLQMSLGESVDLLVAMLVKGSDTLVIAKMVLFVLPLIVVFVALRKTMNKNTLAHPIPLLLSSLTFTIIALQLLPENITSIVSAEQYGAQLQTSSDLVIATTAGVNLLLAIILFKPSKEHKKH